MATVRPSASALGWAVSWARSSGEDTTWVTSRAAQPLGDPLGHLPAELGQVVAGQPAVEHPGRVVHLAVAQQVHDRGLGHPLSSAGGGCGGSRGVREGGRDPASAASSWAAETNQASKADGGR